MAEGLNTDLSSFDIVCKQNDSMRSFRNELVSIHHISCLSIDCFDNFKLRSRSLNFIEEMVGSIVKWLRLESHLNFTNALVVKDEVHSQNSQLLQLVFDSNHFNMLAWAEMFVNSKKCFWHNHYCSSDEVSHSFLAIASLHLH